MDDWFCPDDNRAEYDGIAITNEDTRGSAKTDAINLESKLAAEPVDFNRLSLFPVRVDNFHIILSWWSRKLQIEVFIKIRTCICRFLKILICIRFILT